ncbi:MAG: folylpolyglutamate synthase/dihydrofolate synthase family protein [Thermoanaerobaculia bacterium]
MRSSSEILRGLEQFGIRLGLENLAGLLDEIGRPDEGMPAVLVAGTNGKGSTATLVAAIAGAAGYRVGLYTSPHLEEVEERIRVDFARIAPDRLADHLEEVLAAAARRDAPPPTYFEAVTVAAFLEFRRAGVDLAVLEVGMGGRLDATNIVAPVLSVISSVALDHREFLGDTLDAIAREKAGIMRPDVPVVLSPQVPEAERALVEEATRIGAALVPVGPRLRKLELRSQGLAGIELDLSTDGRTYTLTCPLAGEHQAANVATALVAAEELARLGWDQIDEAAISEGIAQARWPGRLEPVALPDGQGTVLLDAAHNPTGCEALARFVASLGRSYRLLFGALADKEIEGMLPLLAAGADAVVLTRPPSPRAAEPADLARLVAPGLPVRIETEVERALDLALDGYPELLVVCGSIFLVGEVRASLRRRFGVPDAP